MEEILPHLKSQSPRSYSGLGALGGAGFPQAILLFKNTMINENEKRFQQYQ